jgi:hypothetical protein
LHFFDQSLPIGTETAHRRPRHAPPPTPATKSVPARCPYAHDAAGELSRTRCHRRLRGHRLRRPTCPEGHSAPVAYPAPNGRPSNRGNFFTSDSHTLAAGCEPKCRGRSGTKVARPRVGNPTLALLAALLPRQARPSQGGGTGSNPIGAARKRAGQ